MESIGILPFARRRLASDLVSYDPFGQLHIESFMGWKEGGEKGKSWNVKNLLSSSEWSGDK